MQNKDKYISKKMKRIPVNMKMRTVILFFCALLIAPIFMHNPYVSARSIEDLQEVINGLLLQIKTLEKQVAVLRSGETDVVVAFKRDLAIGSRGEDVRTLQKFLNRDALTRVSLAGPGSPGNETAYFGPATKGALIKFQELYSSEILVPVGLTRGTGYFGPSTRSMINKIDSEMASTDTQNESVSEQSSRQIIDDSAQRKPITEESLIGTESQTSTSTEDQIPGNLVIIVSPSTNDNVTVEQPDSVIQFIEISQSILDRLLPNDAPSWPVILHYPSEHNGPPGTEITITGAGFTTFNNTVNFNGLTIDGVKSADGESLSFVIPDDFPPAYYNVYITNTNGKSDSTHFMITDPAFTVPMITGVSPESGSVGTKVTLTGTGFTPSGNVVYTSYDVHLDLASLNGNTIEFTFTNTDDDSGSLDGVDATLDEIASYLGGVPARVPEEVTILVENIGGLSNGISFMLE